jgi:hypothetical protein
MRLTLPHKFQYFTSLFGNFFLINIGELRIKKSTNNKARCLGKKIQLPLSPILGHSSSTRLVANFLNEIASEACLTDNQRKLLPRETSCLV